MIKDIITYIIDALKGRNGRAAIGVSVQVIAANFFGAAQLTRRRGAHASRRESRRGRHAQARFRKLHACRGWADRPRRPDRRRSNPRDCRRFLSSPDAACLVVAPVRHDADRSTAAARANEAAALDDRRERRSIFNAGGLKGASFSQSFGS